MTTTLSAAREPLRAHQIKLKASAADCDRLRAPVLEATDRRDGINAELAKAQATRADLQAAEADAVVARAPRGTQAAFVGKITAADTEIARLQRALVAIESKLVELQRPLADAELSAGILASATEALVAAVVADEAEDVLREFLDAQAKADRAEAAVRTLVGHCVGRSWYALAEKMNVRLNETINTRPPGAWRSERHPRWDQFTAALASDASAAVPVLS
jgi:chromosome segregation ATPase